MILDLILILAQALFKMVVMIKNLKGGLKNSSSVQIMIVLFSGLQVHTTQTWRIEAHFMYMTEEYDVLIQIDQLL